MEQVVDKIIKELTTFSETSTDNGGISDIMKVESLYFGDIGIIPVQNYPSIMVQPVRDSPDSETTGYAIRNLEVLITLAIDIREFFDADTADATGDRQLVKAATAMTKWLRTTANRRLDGEAGNVREVIVADTNYLVEVRGSVIAKSAQLTLTVNKQYPRQN